MSGVAHTPVGPAIAGEAEDTVGTRLRERLAALRAGELGSVPIIIGLILIAIIFQAQNSNFLTAGNFDNLIIQMAGVTTIAIGVVFVLLLGEIDLSVGYASGVAGVTAAELVLPDGSWQTNNGYLAIAVALLVGLGIGLIQGLIITKVGVPSFVTTLAGLLVWQGLLLIIIGEGGTVPISNSTMIDVANKYLSDTVGWLVAIVTVVLYAAAQIAGVLQRRRAGLPAEPVAIVALRIGFVAVVAAVVVIVCNRALGIPLVGVIVIALLVFWSYVATRTRFGRHVYAVGGNAEAARRAGINVDGIRIAVFMISGFMAACGGVILASRLASVNPDAGGGTLLLDAIAAAVIGGTSLFGGRGKVVSALLGALVISSVANGMGLLNISAGKQFVITGLILVAAVVVDSVSRRRLAAVGR